MARFLKEWMDQDEINALIDAMDQLLDDMGENGLSVCKLAKAKARIAFEPFRDLDEHSEAIMSLDVAKAIVAVCDQR